MRVMSLLFLVLAGCAANRPAEDAVAVTYLGGEGLKYETVRPTSPKVEGTITADLTLVELDVGVAETLLGIGDPSDIAPRSFREPMGEIAAVNACYGHGRLLARPTLSLRPAEETPYVFTSEAIYLRDWADESGSPTPQFDSFTEGVEGTLKVTPSKGDISVVVDLTSAQAARPIGEFTTSFGAGTPVKIQIPSVSMVRRVGIETLRPGETAMFQLSRAAHEDGTRIRLLFVRLTD